MLNTLRLRPMKGFLFRPSSVRYMSGAASIRDQFHDAWMDNAMRHTAKTHSIENKKEYGAGYYQKYHTKLKKGYTHPYHSKDNPLSVASMKHGWDILSDLVGPEQVSPHYETLSRSRRGLLFIFAYFGTITSISRLGGWDHNEWLRGLIFHHEYLIALYVGYAELRHFTWIPGPKFTVFYDVFSRYEGMQLASQWNDTAEELSTQFYQFSKNQVDYKKIHNEYKFIKKRSMVNFLTNERLNLEKHFHDRTVGMLKQIKSYEEQNLKNQLKSVSQRAFEATMKVIDENKGNKISDQAFSSALDGIRKGRMDFSKDPVLPIMRKELAVRVADLKKLTPEEESRLLSLSTDQRKAVAQADRGARDAYLSATPHVSSQGLKNHQKFLNFVDYLAGINRKDIQ